MGLIINKQRTYQCCASGNGESSDVFVVDLFNVTVPKHRVKFKLQNV